jgi:creatinine amidohydrolase
VAARIENMTWDEVAEYLKTRNELIIPVGTCEQHGKHMPLNNDSLLAEYFSDYLSDQTGVVVAPILNYGINLPCDKYLAGTTSLDPESLKKVMKSIVEWWEFQGFKKFYIITCHGDPFHIEALSNIAPNLCLLEPWEIKYTDILEKQSTIKHACEAETSIALYLYPEKVRLHKIEERDIPIKQFIGYLNHQKCDRIENHPGCLGFPSYATQEKGEKIIRRMERRILELYKKCRDMES